MRKERTPSFWSFVKNEKFGIGCTGQTVYVYDKSGNSLAKFKDLTYAYFPVISPRGDIFVVKSANGRIAVYSLETLSLVKKFRFSKVDGSQDDNCCFSPDGAEFYNIERHVDSCKTALSVYDTKDFSLKKRLLWVDFTLCLNAIEYDAATDSYFLLGFYRDRATHVADKFFVAKLIDDTLKDIMYISPETHDFYEKYKHIERMGFTDKAKEWSWLGLEHGWDSIENGDYSLAKLWEQKRNS